MRTLAIVSVLLLSSCATTKMSESDSGSYAAGDELTYHEVTEMKMSIESPQGPIPVTSFQESELEMNFVTSDSIEASYSLLEIKMDSPEGKVNPNTESILGDKYTLHLDDSGVLQTLSTPDFPEEIQGATDLKQQFFGFFVSQPEGGLKKGVTWTDSMSHDDDDGSVVNYAGSYEVIGDSLMDGKKVWVVQSMIDVDIAFKDAEVNMTGTMTGPEKGFIYYSQGGVMLARERYGDFSGTMVFEEGAFSMSQTMTYESRIDLVKGGK